MSHDPTNPYQRPQTPPRGGDAQYGAGPQQWQMPPAPPAPPPKKSWFARHKVLTALGVVAVLGIFGAALNGGGESTPPSSSSAVAELAPSGEPMESEGPAEQAAPDEAKPAAEEAEPAPAEPADDVPAEYRAALQSAQSYIDIMPFSEAGLFDQLTSDYGDQFPEDAAQYAVDNVEVDWNEEALESAQSYRETMAMSDEEIRDQLTSEYGEQFTQEQADYAVSNLD